MLVVALLLLLFMQTGKSYTLTLPKVNLPPLPNITIPITGLPQIEVPTVQIPITVVPGTLIPQIGIGGTPAPQQPAALGQRSRSSGCQIQGALPDAACTPGAVMNANTNQICQSGYSSSVRDVPNSEKAQVYVEYGLQSGTPGQYEVDHLVPLELGGSNDIANLWPESASPRPGFHEKDQLENYLHDQVCSGKMSLADAQRQIASNWLSAYNQMPK
jgi:hypothetical protein